MKLNRQGFWLEVILSTKFDRKKHVACSSSGVCKPGKTGGAYDQPSESSRELWRPQVDPSKEEAIELAMPFIGGDKSVSGIDQVELKSKGKYSVEGGRVKSNSDEPHMSVGEPNTSVGEPNMAVGEMSALCNTAISEDGEDHADFEMVSHDASDICGELRRLVVLVVGERLE